MDAVGNVIGLGTSRYTRTYTSFSGTDIKVVFHNQVMAEIQGISYSVTREKAPSYVMGSADPVSFSRGKLLPTSSVMKRIEASYMLETPSIPEYQMVTISGCGQSAGKLS